MDDDPTWLPYFFLGLMFGVIFSICTLVSFRIEPGHLTEVGMSYPDLAAILLGAVAVIVTVLGVFIAILALWGYSQFRKSAKSAVIQYVKSEFEAGKIRDEISDIVIQEVIRQLNNGKLDKLIEDAVNRNIITGPDRRISKNDEEPIGDEEKEYGA